MKWIKSILATVIAFACCYFWGQFTGFTSFSFAYVLHFILMPWYVYLDSVFKWKYNSSYFQTRDFENKGAIYKIFGVNFYRKLLFWSGWERISRKDIRICNKKDALEFAEYRSRSSEAGHTLLFFIIGLITLLVANSFKEAFWLILLNVLINVYPVLVQRYNRPRFKRVLFAIESKQKE